MRQIKRIFVHCTASSQKWGVKELQAEFKRKGWRNPGYHYVITAKGRIYGENQVSPKNQNETQPRWYDDKFEELLQAI